MSKNITLLDKFMIGWPFKGTPWVRYSKKHDKFISTKKDVDGYMQKIWNIGYEGFKKGYYTCKGEINE